MFEVQVRHVQGQTILDLSGPLGREGGEAILRAVQALPSLPGHLILNFSRVGQINSAGIGGVLWVVRMLARQGGKASAFGLNDHFRKVFHVMGLTHYIRLTADEATALEEGHAS